MMVTLVWWDMPELLLPLLEFDRLAVGVVTDTEVELLTDPSVAVTTMTVVDVVGVGVAVVLLESDVDVVSPEESAVEAAASVEVEVGDVLPPLPLSWDVEVEVVSAAAVVVVEGVVAASVVVVSAVVVGSVEVALVLVLVVVSASDVEDVVEAAESSPADVAAAAVLPLPLAARSLRRESSLRTISLLDWAMMAASIMKPWATEVADSAAASSCSIRLECMVAVLENLVWEYYGRSRGGQTLGDNSD